jgi:hypothetical protein
MLAASARPARSDALFGELAIVEAPHPLGGSPRPNDTRSSPTSNARVTATRIMVSVAPEKMSL